MSHATTNTRPLHLVPATSDAAGTPPVTTETKVHAALRANPGATTATVAMAAGVGRSTAAKLLTRWAKEGTVIRADGTDPNTPATWTIDTTDAPRDTAEAVSVTDQNTGDDSPTIPDTVNGPDVATDDANTDAPDGTTKADPADTTAAPGEDITTSADTSPSAPDVDGSVDTTTGGPAAGHHEATAAEHEVSTGQAAAPDGSGTEPADAEPSTVDSDADQAAAPSTDAPATPTAQESPKDRLPKGGLYELVKSYLAEHPGDSFGPAKLGTELTRSGGAVNNALEKLVADGHAIKTCEAPKRFAYNTAT